MNTDFVALYFSDDHIMHYIVLAVCVNDARQQYLIVPDCLKKLFRRPLQNFRLKSQNFQSLCYSIEIRAIFICFGYLDQFADVNIFFSIMDQYICNACYTACHLVILSDVFHNQSYPSPVFVSQFICFATQLYTKFSIPNFHSFLHIFLQLRYKLPLKKYYLPEQNIRRQTSCPLKVMLIHSIWLLAQSVNPCIRIKPNDI